ncbi:MAG TPA: hypothetical protein VGF03_11760 [Bryobacteraceae bacterium]|jgi:hypothetical protein
MKTILAAILLLAPALAWAAKPAPSPADYSITVHVQSSRLNVLEGRSNPNFQHLTVLIDARKYELESVGGPGVIRVGDYKARIAQDETKRAYEYQRTYEFLFTDGTARQFRVVGEGE